MDEEDTSQLEAELKSLETKYADMQKEYDAKISQLQSEVEAARTNLSNQGQVPSKLSSKYFELVYNLKKENMDKVTSLEHQHRINVSQLKLEVAEKNREISTQQSQNAQLFIENLNKNRTIEELTLLIEKMKNDIKNSRSSIKKYVDNITRKEVSVFNKSTQPLENLFNELPTYSKKVRMLQNKIEHLNENDKRFAHDYNQYLLMIDHFVRSICFLTDNPMDCCPSAQHLIDSPKFFERFLLECEEKSKKCYEKSRNALTKSSASLSQLLKVKNTEINLPLANVLSNLGAVSLDVIEEMETHHKETMSEIEQKD